MNLVLLTFEAPEELVRAYVPSGLEPDRWDGKTHVTLVALQLLDIKVLGWRIPGFGGHPQVNFRTYVRCGAERAVTFIRELVPSRLVAAVARAWYGEPFRAVRMEARVEPGADAVRVQYRFGAAEPRWRIAVTGSRDGHVPPAGSVEHHLKERTLGCRTDRRGRLQTFRVEHPPWAIREVRAVDYEVDFGSLYGAEWGFLNGKEPASVIFAVGSEVAVDLPSAVSGPRS